MVLLEQLDIRLLRRAIQQEDLIKTMTKAVVAAVAVPVSDLLVTCVLPRR